LVGITARFNVEGVLVKPHFRFVRALPVPFTGIG
jgi:hypothetical protein